MLKFIFNLFFVSFFFVSDNIYSIKLTDLNGSPIDLGSYKGKKILIVNIASKYKHSSRQLKQLDSLQNTYDGKMIIIAVPSNDFNNENRKGNELKNYYLNTVHHSFIICSPMNVSGANQSELYKWLTSKDKNGRMSSKVEGDFQKYLIDENGDLIAFFTPIINPFGKEVRKEIEK